MPRQPRLQVPSGAFHVTARGVARQSLFRDDEDRRRFLKLLADVVARRDWVCHGFCLMTTHYHVLVRTPQPDLARGMQYLNACYAQSFNRRHGETGHRLERRYHSVFIESDAHAMEVLRYLALNPVRAAACTTPEGWPWSSYAALTGRAPAPPFLATDWALAYFGSNRERARTRLEAFVHDASDRAAVVKGSDPGT
jgi:putative transposase